MNTRTASSSPAVLRDDSTPHVGVRAGWQRDSKMRGDRGVPESDVDVLGVGLVYRF